jgi:hypothetical protein
MDGSFSTSEVVPATPPAVRRTRRLRLKKRRRRVRPAIRYSMMGLGVLLAALFAQFAIHTYRTDPRDARTIAERELQLNTLGEGERVIRMVSVFQRPWIDYFRATRGLLVLTNRRLLFLGLEPRDLLASGDSPPTFEERDFPVDTLVTLAPGRTFFGIARAIVVDTPDDSYRFGVPSEAWGKASLLLHSIEARHERLYAEGVQAAQRREALEARRRVAAQEALKAKYYTVRRGDALSSIAARWNTTADRLREWNSLPSNKIRIGQQLLVKPKANESAVAGEVGLKK